MTRYSRVGCNWGELFGLSPENLTLEQLKSLKFEKLVEFLGLDSRIPHMIAVRIFGENPQQVAYLKQLSEEEILHYPQIIHAYNRYLDNQLPQMEGYARQEILVWHMMNDHHKSEEVSRWAKNERSIINDDNVDYDWLVEKYPEKAEQKIGKFLKKLHEDEYYRYGYGWNGVKHMVAAVPPPHVRGICGILFDPKNKKKNKELQLLSLANKHLPPEYVIKALKIGSKRLYWPKVNANISVDILKELPTVTRLDIIEKLIQMRYKIPGLKEESDFRALMFGATMRHPERVERAVKFFEYVKPKETP